MQVNSNLNNLTSNSSSIFKTPPMAAFSGDPTIGMASAADCVNVRASFPTLKAVESIKEVPSMVAVSEPIGDDG